MEQQNVSPITMRKLHDTGQLPCYPGAYLRTTTSESAHERRAEGIEARPPHGHLRRVQPLVNPIRSGSGFVMVRSHPMDQEDATSGAGAQSYRTAPISRAQLL